MGLGPIIILDHFFKWDKLIFHPLVFQAEGILSSVYPSVRPSINLSQSQIWAAITIFVPNMHHGILKMGAIDLALQGHFGNFDTEF